MAGRLLTWPVDLGFKRIVPLTGPRSVGAGSTESRSGFVQSVASPFGLWRMRFDLAQINVRNARSITSLITALHGGANAVRVPFPNPYPLSWGEAGIAGAGENDFAPRALNWGNGRPWGNGVSWRASLPTVPVAAASAKGDTVVTLSTSMWGGRDALDQFIGFAPYHFGVYRVTESLGGGRHRIWPPLRRALTTSNWATLSPVGVFRLEGEAGASITFERLTNEGTSLTMVEVEDSLVRSWFTG